MPNFRRLTPPALILAAVLATGTLCNAAPISASQTKVALRRISTSPDVSRILSQIAKAAMREFPEKLTPDNFAMSLIVDNDPNPRIGGYHERRPFYPASVIKICYATALEHAFEIGKLERNATTLSDLDLMLRISSNSATNRILDRLTQTESRPELPAAELAIFAAKRQTVNDYLRMRGFRDTNACQKTWDIEPFGRDLQFLGTNFENRNQMTCEETARLIWLIKHEKVASAAGCQEILDKIRRRPANTRDIQACRIGGGIPTESALWSKAGWTDNTNHDAAYVELPKGEPFVLVIFTNTSWKDAEIIRWITKRVVTHIQLGSITPQTPKAG
ncbi:MAG: serine hydrolase, partial [Armatimonadota bacterium]